MRTEVLREFIVLAQHLNFRVAAEKLHITQPRLSIHISDLEKEIGFQLISRDNPIALTNEGKVFLDTIAQIVDDLDRTIASCLKTAKQKSSRITIVKPPYMSDYPAIIAQGLNRSIVSVTKECPNVSCLLPQALTTHSEYDSLREGKTDVAYVALCLDSANDATQLEPFDGVIVRPIYKAPYVAWVRKEHPLANCGNVSLEELACYTILLPGVLEISSYRESIKELFCKQNLSPHYRTIFTDTASAFMMAFPNEEDAYIMPSFLGTDELPATFDLMTLKTDGVESMASIGIAFLKKPNNPAVLHFVDILTGQPYTSKSQE